MTGKVVIHCANGDVWEILPGEKLTMGRTSKNDMRIVDSKYNSISRTHAMITWDPADEGPRVTDLNSSNGTLVNGTWIKEPVMLKNGDKLVLGKTEPMRIEFGPKIKIMDATGGVSFTGGQIKHRSVALEKAPSAEDSKETGRWERPDTAGNSSSMVVSGRAGLLDALSGLAEDRKTGIMTLPGDNCSIGLLRGRIVAATMKELIGNNALDELLKLKGKITCSFVEMEKVARGGMSLVPEDLLDE